MTESLRTTEINTQQTQIIAREFVFFIAQQRISGVGGTRKRVYCMCMQHEWVITNMLRDVHRRVSLYHILTYVLLYVTNCCTAVFILYFGV